MNEEQEDTGRDKLGRFKIGALFGGGVAGRSGQKPKYDSPEQMFDKIAEYLKWEERSSKGKYTMEGCALYLGFNTRQSLHDYKKRDGYSEVVERFMLFLQHYHAQRLTFPQGYMGSQFWLKNWGGYKDEVIQQQNQTITEVRPTVVDSGTPLASEEDK